MKKTYTIEEIYEVVRREENCKDYARKTYGRDSEEYERELSWYSAISYAFYAVTGVHYDDYKKEHADEV